MTNQTPSLFASDAYGGCSASRPAIKPADPQVTGVERERTEDQCHRIIERLKQGPATNDELSAIARKYTSRISDLRKAGYVIECFDRNHATGLTRYRLVSGD